MSGIAQEAARLMDILPEKDREFAFEFIKKMVLAWDPDFTKTTSDEAEKIRAAEQSGFVDEDDIDWDSIGIDN